MRRKKIKKIFRTCRGCHRKFVTYSTSSRRYCQRCHKKIAMENVKQMKRKEGKYYARYLTGLQAFLARAQKKAKGE